MLRWFRNCDGSAAVEAAMFSPIFLTLLLGIPDLGNGMFTRMTVNSASQAGAAYAVIKSNAALSDIKAVMNQAAANPSFCSSATCSASMQSQCPSDPSTECVITVTASYPFSPMLPSSLYSWAIPSTIVSKTTIRVR